MRSFILAGGFGTRISSVIGDLPKPMAAVGDRPFLEYLVLQLRSQGLKEITICTGYQGEKIERYFGRGARWGVCISYSQETEPLGTGGAVKKATAGYEDGDFLVMNGDSFVDADIRALIHDHLACRARATMALLPVDDASRFGRVELESGRICGFMEKGHAGPGLINGGIYVLHRSVLEGISEGRASLELDVFPELVGRDFFGKVLDGFFVDIGIPEDYYRIIDKPELISRFTRLEGVECL